MHRDVRGAGLGDDTDEIGVGAAARDVVHHPRARVEGGAGDLGLGGVDADRNIELTCEPLHDGEHPAQFLADVHRFGTRAGRLTADVDHRRAGPGQLQSVGDARRPDRGRHRRRKRSPASR